MAGNGTAGSGGAAGAAGTSGGAGTSGTAGASGASGNAGTAGAAGAAGAAGTAGAAGAAGTAGAAGAAGTGGVAGTSGSAGAGGMAGTSGGGGAMAGAGGASCQSTGLTFTPRAPTVLILVDRGGSEFTTATTGTFFNVRSAVEDAIAPIEDQYRLGFAAYTGQHPTTSTCSLVYDSVPFATHNASTIETSYEALGPLLPYPTAKAETPASQAIPLAQAALAADTGTGGRYLLFLTTGATDFCDDGNSACPPDALTSQLQQLYAGSPTIQTLVVGLPSPTTNPVEAGVLQALANAGVGQPVAYPSGSPYTQTDLYYACSISTDGGSQSWPTLFGATGKAVPNPIATYSATGGTAPLYNAATNAVTDIETQVKAALLSTKACEFDLATYAINPSKLGEGTVTLNGAALAQDAATGWSMPTTTELRLNGPACTAYRTANATITFAFPCDTVQ
jgi:hypothetical protein